MILRPNELDLHMGHNETSTNVEHISQAIVHTGCQHFASVLSTVDLNDDKGKRCFSCEKQAETENTCH